MALKSFWASQVSEGWAIAFVALGGSAERDRFSFALPRKTKMRQNKQDRRRKWRRVGSTTVSDLQEHLQFPMACSHCLRNQPPIQTTLRSSPVRFCVWDTNPLSSSPPSPLISFWSPGSTPASSPSLCDCTCERSHSRPQRLRHTATHALGNSLDAMRFLPFAWLYHRVHSSGQTR